MEKVSITCTNTGKTVLADVISRNDKSMKVAFQGTTITLQLFRKDPRRPYVGHMAGQEFTTNG